MLQHVIQAVRNNIPVITDVIAFAVAYYIASATGWSDFESMVFASLMVLLKRGN